MNEIEYCARNTPGPTRYKIKNETSLQERSIIIDMKKDKIKRNFTIKRDMTPSPCSYNVIESINKCKLKKSFKLQISKSKDIKFIDAEIKKKKEIPGVGAYKKSDAAWAKCSWGTTTPKFKKGI